MGVRGLWEFVVYDPSVWGEVDDGVTEVVVEAVVEWAVWDGFGPVEVSVFYGFFGCARFTDFIPIVAEVPFADAGGVVSIFSE